MMKIHPKEVTYRVVPLSAFHLTAKELTDLKSAGLPLGLTIGRPDVMLVDVATLFFLTDLPESMKPYWSESFFVDLSS